MNHHLGTCRPCYYVANRAGCRYGRGCTFCHHADHNIQRKEIPGKSKRIKYKALTERLYEWYARNRLPYTDALVAMQESDGFPHHDRVSANFMVKLLKNLYKKAGQEGWRRDQDSEETVRSQAVRPSSSWHHCVGVMRDTDSSGSF